MYVYIERDKTLAVNLTVCHFKNLLPSWIFFFFWYDQDYDTLIV